jgi:uncharacterized membrane protein
LVVVYQALLYLHILSGVTWVGGSFYAQLLAISASRADDPYELPRLGERFEFLGTRVFVPAAALLLVSGTVMTAQAWSFGQTWIVVSIGLWVLSAVAGAIYLAPRAKRARQLFEAEGPTSDAARQLTARLFLVSRIELLSFAAIIALMVFKPGS